MNNGHSDLHEFGKCRLDIGKRILWCEEELVQLPLKAVELLCVLVGKGGEVATKDEIWRDVWPDAFVEETNLAHNIYLLRKTFKVLGELDLIQTIPRRGYRFAGEVREIQNSEIIVEKHTQTQTLIEIHDEPEPRALAGRLRRASEGRFFTVSVATSILFGALLGGLLIWGYQNSPAKTSADGTKSIAVLPFTTIDSNKDNEGQGLGLADILITRLSNIKEINVRPTSAVLSFEKQEQDSTSFGKKLQVDAVLEGTIYRTNDKVRVTARLVKVDDSSPIWAGQFEKPLQDEFRLQDEIALQIVEALALNLSGGEKNALTKPYTESSDAYQLYLKGRYEWNKRNYFGMIEAQRLFRNAIEKDPNFALAYVGLADTINTGPNTNEAADVIEKALELDPNLGEAHASLGFFKMFHGREWQEAESAFKRSIELNPNYATAHHWYATLLAIKGLIPEAKAEMHRALELNPLSYNFLADLGQLHYFAGEYVEAKEYCNKALEIYPDFMFAHQYLHYIYLKTGEFDKAIEEIIKTDKINGAFDNASAKQNQELDALSDRCRKYYRRGGIAGYMEFRFAGTPDDPESFYFYAMKHAFLGEKEKALDYLERAGQARTFLSAFVKAEPIFDKLRNEPRFKEILLKVKLAE